MVSWLSRQTLHIRVSYTHALVRFTLLIFLHLTQLTTSCVQSIIIQPGKPLTDLQEYLVIQLGVAKSGEGGLIQ